MYTIKLEQILLFSIVKMVINQLLHALSFMCQCFIFQLIYDSKMHFNVAVSQIDKNMISVLTYISKSLRCMIRLEYRIK